MCSGGKSSGTGKLSSLKRMNQGKPAQVVFVEMITEDRSPQGRDPGSLNTENRLWSLLWQCQSLPGLSAGIKWKEHLRCGDLAKYPYVLLKYQRLCQSISYVVNVNIWRKNLVVFPKSLEIFPNLQEIFLFIKLFIYGHGYFLLCIYVFVPCSCLVPLEARRWHWISYGSRVTDGYGPPCAFGDSNLSPLEEQADCLLN